MSVLERAREAFARVRGDRDSDPVAVHSTATGYDINDRNDQRLGGGAGAVGTGGGPLYEVPHAHIGAACPGCNRPTDAKRRCWDCCDRACCECGRPTGSAFIARCYACGHRFNDNRGEPL
jgi:hypothetical protein